jgi:predicted ATP-binding protein involved in virulence
MELDDTVTPQNKDQRYREYQNIIARRKEIEQVARALGGSNHTQTQIDRFFEKLSNAYASTDEEQEIGLVEWLLNKAQIQRIDAILREMERNKKNAAAIFAPIDEFIGAANFFFNDSKKHVNIDSLGELLVQRGGETIPLPSLSSGDRQMLTLLAHVVFMPKRNAGIVIIDEPELSLHLRWQEHLVAKLTELNSKLQFIFATHSPEIVGMRKDKTLRVVR